MELKRRYNKVVSWVVILLIVTVFSIYFYEMMQIAIVDADIYKEMIQGVNSSSQHIKAVRGEITDRNGVPLVQNQITYDVILDKAFLPKEKQNSIILDLIRLFRQTGYQWVDNLPITHSAPFEYQSEKPAEVEGLKSFKDAQVYTVAADMMSYLIEDYGLEDFSLVEAREIAGVRYEMERRDFSNANPYVFAEGVDSDLIVTVKERSYLLPGVDVRSSTIRQYPDGSIAPHILGYTGPLQQGDLDELKGAGKRFDAQLEPYDTVGYTLDDTIGRSGIEKALEDQLRGENGLREIQTDANGQVVSVAESISPIPGNTIRLTIDADLQQRASEYLEAQIKHLNETQPKGRGGDAHSGAAVVLNPKTGEILAAVTYPSYNINQLLENYSRVAGQPGTPLVDRSIQGVYTPGSIYKPVVALAGLNTGTITEHSAYNCTGRYTFFAPYTPKCLSTHGRISIHNAIAWSCNIFFYETGRNTGIEEVDKMAERLGLGQPTGIEIIEGVGQRSNPQSKEARGAGEWYGADTIQTAIGQFDTLVSPLQMANYAATIANRGKRMKLTLINEVQDFYGREIVKKLEPEVTYDLTPEVTPEAFEITIKGMVGATTGSSGGTFSGYPVEVASKTGTPQVTEEIVNSTFITFAPADDPELAIAVVIEEGWQGYTGAPVAKAIYDDYFGVDHRGAVASGPQRLKDYRAANPALGESGEEPTREIDAIFPQFANNPAALSEKVKAS